MRVDNYCPLCGLELPADADVVVMGDEHWVCSECAQVCASCDQFGYTDEGAVVVVDEDTGTQAWVCGGCL
jgi:ribosome-binding protein aMBF1 (putative translation factor)